MWLALAGGVAAQADYVDDGQSGLTGSIGYARLGERGGVQAMLAATVAGRVDMGTTFARVASADAYITSYRPFLTYAFLKADTINPIAMGVSLHVEKTAYNYSDSRRDTDADFIGAGFTFSLDLANHAGRFSRLKYSFGFAHMASLSSDYPDCMLAQMAVRLLVYSPEEGAVWVLQPTGAFTMGERHESTIAVSLAVTLDLRERVAGR